MDKKRQVSLEADKTIFCDLVGYSPESKILEYLIEIRGERFTFSDTINAVGINRKRAYGILNYYLKLGLLKRDKKLKQTQFYKLNMRNEVVRYMVRFFDKAIAQ